MEDILMHFLQPPLSASAGRTDEYKKKAMEVFRFVENKPLSADDCRLVRNSLMKFIADSNLHQDKQLQVLLSTRFAFDYLPGVSSLGLSEKLSAPETDSPSTGSSAPLGQVKSSDCPTGATISLPDEELTGTAGTTRFYLCSVRRQQSALSTTFRLYLDGSKDYHTASGNLIKTSLLNTPVFLYGAKKFKNVGGGSNAAHCSIFDTPDVKHWKGKNAIARIARTRQVPPLDKQQPECDRYFGHIVAWQGQIYRQEQSAQSSPVHPSETFVPAKSHAGDDAVDEGDTGAEGGDPPPNVESNIFAAASTSASRPATSTVAPTATSTSSDVAGVLVEVRSRGADKLIHVTAAAAASVFIPAAATIATATTTPPDVILSSEDVASPGSGDAARSYGGAEDSSSVHGCSGGVGGVGTIETEDSVDLQHLPVPPDSGTAACASAPPKPPSVLSSDIVDPTATEHKLVMKLAELHTPTSGPSVSAAARTTRSTEEVCAGEAVLLIRSKLPRKVPHYTGAGSGSGFVHAVAFSKDSRVRAPSRKNLVLEAVKETQQMSGRQQSHASGSGGRVNRGAEWTPDSDKIPLLQMGKLDENIFSLDFCTKMVPFQAFVIAMAALDQ